MLLTVDEAIQRYVERNPMSQRLHDARARVMPGGNTRSVLHVPPFPLTIVRGDGARIWDADGHEYLDFLGEYTAGLYGHSQPAIVEAIETALADGIVLGGPNRYELTLAEAICERFPSIELLRFCNSGTEANVMAVSLARAVTGRSKVVVFEGGYHGGVLSFAHGGSPVNAPFEFVVGEYNDPVRRPSSTTTWRRCSSSRCRDRAASSPATRRSCRRCATRRLRTVRS